MCASLNKSNKWIFIWKSIWCAEETMQEWGVSLSFWGHSPTWPCASPLLCLHSNTRCWYLLEWWLIHRETSHIWVLLRMLEDWAPVNRRGELLRTRKSALILLPLTLLPLLPPLPPLRHFLSFLHIGGLFQLSALFPNEDNNYNL